MSLFEAVKDYLDIRPACKLLAYIEDADYPAIFRSFESQNVVVAVRIRSIFGESFSIVLNDTQCVFIDQMDTEYALHIFDAVFGSRASYQDLHLVAKALEEKQLSRLMFSMGRTAEAYITACMDRPRRIEYNSAMTQLTAHVNAERRAQFERDFEAFALSHELAHAELRITPGASKDIQDWLSRTLMNISFDDAAADKIRMLHEGTPDPVTAENVSLFSESGEADIYYSVANLAKHLHDPRMIREITCDLIAASIVIKAEDFKPERLTELSLHIVLNSNVTTLIRRNYYVLMLTEYCIDAVTKVAFENLEDWVAAFSKRMADFAKANRDAYSIVQQGLIRKVLLKEFVVERVCGTPSAAITESDLRQAMMAAELKFLDFMNAIVGPVKTWAHWDRLVCIILAEGKNYRQILVERHGDAELVEAMIREKYLELNGIL